MRARTILWWLLCGSTLAANAGAVTSAEVFAAEPYRFGRFSARIQFAPGSGVVSSFFLWKDGSEVEGTFWNELDFEKLEAECRVETNTIYGNPVGLHSQRHDIAADLCGSYHVYVYEWTPEYLLWTVDGVEIRRETGDVVQAYAQNAPDGMQFRFNVWPGDETFGGVFNPSILPVYQYVDWIEYASYTNGSFEVQWRDDFTEGTLPARWSTASWESPKGLSLHAASNVAIKDGYLVLALTSDDATGTAGASPAGTDTEPDPTGSTMPDPSTSASESSAPNSDESQTSATEGSSTSEASSSAPDGDSTSDTGATGDVSSSATTMDQASTSGQTTAAPTSAPSTSATVTGNTSQGQTMSVTTDVMSQVTSTSALAESSSGSTSSESPMDTNTSGTGCACRVGSQSARNPGLAGLGLFMLTALLRRSRRDSFAQASVDKR